MGACLHLVNSFPHMLPPIVLLCMGYAQYCTHLRLYPFCIPLPHCLHTQDYQQYRSKVAAAPRSYAPATPHHGAGGVVYT